MVELGVVNFEVLLVVWCVLWWGMCKSMGIEVSVENKY